MTNVNEFMSTLLGRGNGNQVTKAEIGLPTENQMNYYKTLCAQHKVEVKEGLTFQTIRVEIETLKAMPIIKMASDRQKDTLLSYGITDVDNLTFDEASAQIEKFYSKEPCTKAQLEAVMNLYRFGIIPVLPAFISKTMASKWIGNETYSKDYKEISAGKASLAQCTYIQKLQGNQATDIRELSGWTRDVASAYIAKLEEENRHRRENRNDASMDIIEGQDTSRSREMEIIKTYDELHHMTKKSLYNRMHSELLGVNPEQAYSDDNFLKAVKFIIATFGENEMIEWLEVNVK